jgi:hypothetical protein
MFSIDFENLANKQWQHCTTLHSKDFYFYWFCVCDFIDFVCEFTVKTTEHTVASYESSDFT